MYSVLLCGKAKKKGPATQEGVISENEFVSVLPK